GHQAFQNLGDFSLALWFRIEMPSSGINTLFSGARAGAFNNLLIYLNADCTVFNTWVNNIQTGTFPIGASVNDGLWHHLVWTRRVSDGAEAVYLDGSPRSDSNGSRNTSTVSLDPGGVVVGQEQDSLGGNFAQDQCFHGWIDELMVFNRALSMSEVGKLYTLTHSCSGPCYTAAIAEYRMDDSTWTIDSPSVADSAGSYDGIPRGSAAVNHTDSHLCYSGEFTNDDSYIEIAGLPVSTAIGDRTTVTFWMKWAGGTGEMPIGWGSRYDLYFFGGSFGFNTACSDLLGVSGADALSGGWHHVAAVFTNNQPSKNLLFIDGILQPSTLLAGSQCNRAVSSNFYISGWDSGESYKYNGLIDELRIYSRGLSVSEVMEDMNSTHSCPGGP
ncbi:MAG: hypothetical protein DRH12_15395, partial [Deltaproteobacteria bacterium]